MFDRLPPLTALRAFEAAARHMSFAKAAEELNVTPAALSFQIKSLEEHLGQPVFRRLNRAVELTEVGRALAPGAQEGFAMLNTTWRNARRLGDQSHLTATSGPGFTSLWLAPRLFQFASAHPEIELRLSGSLKVLDFDRDEIDVAIRYGSGDSDDAYSEPLGLEWATPMVAPALAEQFRTAADLKDAVLLVDETTERIDPAIGWSSWFSAAGLKRTEQAQASFNTPDLAVGAAIAGAGVLMGRISLTEAALRDGRLVMPFDLTLEATKTYRIVCPKASAELPHIDAFIQWIKAEYALMEPLSAGRRFVAAEA